MEKPEKILDPDKEYHLPEPKTEIERLHHKLYEILGNFYKTQDKKFVEEYHAVYAQMRASGWDGGLDVDQILPEHLMPQEYIDSVRGLR